MLVVSRMFSQVYVPEYTALAKPHDLLRAFIPNRFRERSYIYEKSRITEIYNVRQC